MKKFLATTIASLTLIATSAAMAAPPASASAERPFACVMSVAMKGTTATTRGALYGNGDRPCRHSVANNVRWGNAQKPCAYSIHSA